MRPFLYLMVSMSFANGFERSPVVAAKDGPERFERIGDGHWFVDFGEAAFGTVQITSSGKQRKVTVHMGEALAGDGRIDREPGGTVRYQKHEVTLRPKEAARPALNWSPPEWMEDGYLSLPKGCPEIMPFRYVEIEGAPATFSAQQIRRVSWSVPFNEQASAFQSSSPELDAVWRLCKHSIKATSFMGLYVDGDRERKPYEADALINQLSHYCLDARYDTARLTHEYLLEKPTWPTEWRLQSVILGWHDFLWSGDDRSLWRNYEVLKGKALCERRTKDGLFLGWNEGEPKDIVDWPAIERDGYDMEPGVKTAVTAFHYRALVLLERMARHQGKSTEARKFAAMAKQTQLAVNARLWDDARGCYVDGLDPESGEVSTHASAHANFLPLALGLVPEDRLSRVAAYVKQRGMACSVYGAQFLLDALYDAGEAEHALSLLVSRGERSWLNMSEKVGSTITLEAWDPSLKPNLDWNHAWGAAPSNIIARRLMGIEPVEPGFKRFRVQPQTASLERAKIKMPTPRGPVVLEIQGKDAAMWMAKLSVPAGTTAEFHVPFPGDVVTEGRGKSAPLPAKGDRKVLGLGSGDWIIRMRK
jgi:alpha-L-rhamnosidase